MRFDSTGSHLLVVVFEPCLIPHNQAVFFPAGRPHPDRFLLQLFWKIWTPSYHEMNLKPSLMGFFFRWGANPRTAPPWPDENPRCIHTRPINPAVFLFLLRQGFVPAAPFFADFVAPVDEEPGQSFHHPSYKFLSLDQLPSWAESLSRWP